MADVLSKAARSELMSRIRSRGNERTELALARLLRREGITGWRRHLSISLKKTPDQGTGPTTKGVRPRSGVGRVPSLGGRTKANPRRRTAVRPDFVFRKERVIIFVDGCFWHGCPIHGTRPKDNRAFWRKKITANQTRDRRVHRTLRNVGWKVLRIWEHSLRLKGVPSVLRRIDRALAANSNHR